MIQWVIFISAVLFISLLGWWGWDEIALWYDHEQHEFESSDRFVCRREGHIPAIRVTRQNAVTDKPFKYLTTCQRCGKFYEETMDDAA